MNINLSSISFTGAIKSNKNNNIKTIHPLLGNPIKDTFERSSKNENMKTSYINENLIENSSYVHIRKTKDKDFSDRLDKKISELSKQNIKVLKCISSQFLNDEFYLKQYHPDTKKTTYVSYDFKMNAVAEESTDRYYSKEYNCNVKETRIKNFKNNSEHVSIRNIDSKLEPLLKSEIVKKDKNGNITQKEIMKPSEVSGIMDVEYQYPNGRKEIVSKGTIDKKTGIVTVKKDLKSADGTRTEFLYEDDPKGNRIIDYKITDKDGKILMNNSQTFEVISDNKFRSSNNNDTYEITVGEKDLTVKDLRRNLEAKIDFKDTSKKNEDSNLTNESISLLKKISGKELFDSLGAVKQFKNLPKEKTLKSFFDSNTKQISTSDNLFVFLHELGHAKDNIKPDKNYKGISIKQKLFGHDTKIQELWKEERKSFNENATDIERYMIDYFIQTRGHSYGQYGGLYELVAETNAITNSIPTKEAQRLGERAQVVQQHFPKTIAAINDAMNWKNDIYAIEYYGT